MTTPIEFRNIHSAPKSAFNGLSSYFNKKFGQKLRTLPHLVRDSLQVIKEINKIAYSGDEIFARLDVKSFFMSGRSYEISSSSCKIFDQNERDLMAEGAFWLLDNQFVEVERLPDRIWKVEFGTGMGLRHSGEVADASFYGAHEKGAFG